MAGSASIDALSQLNAELLAIARARLPIATELTRAADSLEGREAGFSKRIAERCEAGEPLADAVAAEAPELPPYYATLIRVGESSGRMTAALESLGDALATVQRLRRASRFAVAYPLAVAFVAWLVALLATSVCWPVYDWISGQRAGAPSHFEATRQWASAATLTIPPLLVAIGVAVLIWRSRQNGALAPLKLANAFPGVGSVVRLEAYASFCRLLGLQVANRVPLDEALPLAAEATGWRPFFDPAQSLAASLRRGEDVATRSDTHDALPPLALLPLSISTGTDLKAEALSHAATHYQQKADLAANVIAKLAPVFATVIIGGTALLGFAAVVLGPYLVTLWTLSDAGWR